MMNERFIVYIKPMLDFWNNMKLNTQLDVQSDVRIIEASQTRAVSFSLSQLERKESSMMGRKKLFKPKNAIKNHCLRFLGDAMDELNKLE
ncbi:hypothetical protein RO3G_09397 [Rhizopus delemar RA 99-880]|uniref:Uncharacterized protein n=1 Tax=Rhizopus delemar (strain RA 99-880 / ATCC MYA-4621 / FGSC 9543 / NRRL 43880) TaxID=246409 RepID=I1C8A7_RHIO9|nr:hypothetical protein RO3G_09397 [Rhizopus delemar RA 99-880]|eukprot:EIE84687.1 hypothetical protein RO3G_09397 [Rhizopus delemar RA 99-880]